MRGRKTPSASSLAVALVLSLVVLSACGSNQGDSSGETTDTVAVDDASSGSTVSRDIKAMPADGSGESQALAALPGLLDDAKAKVSASAVMPDVEGATPILTAYIVSAELDDQTSLFEVRADGIAHSLHAYSRAFDSGSMVWTPVDGDSSIGLDPRSGGEVAAAVAVRAAMADAFPSSTFGVRIYGYRFIYVRGSSAILTLEVAPGGTLISATVW